MNWILFIQKLLNDNLGVVTFIVGFLAIYIYIKQKADKKRDTAKLILQEIRYAEQQIKKYKDFKSYNMPNKLLPTNSWNDNIHMFVKDLKETDIDLITAFYAKTAYIDTLIIKISDYKNQPRTLNINPTLAPQPLATVQSGNNPLPSVVNVVYDPMQGTQDILSDVSANIDFIYNSPTVEKLRQISERKWYQPF